MLFVKDKSECAVNALWSGVLMSQHVWHLDCCPLRHGVPGGSHGGSEPGPPGARRWPWSYHHLLLKKKKKYKTLAPHPAHVDCCHGYRSPGIFEGRSLIWFLWRGGTTCDWRMSEGPQDEGKQFGLTGWEYERSVCPRWATVPLHVEDRA